MWFVDIHAGILVKNWFRDWWGVINHGSAVSLELSGVHLCAVALKNEGNFHSFFFIFMFFICLECTSRGKYHYSWKCC